MSNRIVKAADLIKGSANTNRMREEVALVVGMMLSCANRLIGHLPQDAYNFRIPVSESTYWQVWKAEGVDTFTISFRAEGTTNLVWWDFPSDNKKGAAHLAQDAHKGLQALIDGMCEKMERGQLTFPLVLFIEAASYEF